MGTWSLCVCYNTPPGASYPACATRGGMSGAVAAPKRQEMPAGTYTQQQVQLLWYTINYGYCITGVCLVKRL